MTQTETEFLGLIVGIDGIKIGKEREKVVRDWANLSTITELRGFVGLLQFFHRLIRNSLDMAAPLTNLTRKGTSIKIRDATCDEAFARLKERLVSAPKMMVPDWSKPFKCHTDACQRAVGGALTQYNDKKEERVISYFSKRLSTAEENCSANDRKLFGLIYFLKQFRRYLEGRSFEILTDNQTLENIFIKKFLRRRETGWIEFLGQFDISQMIQINGMAHVLGDVMSRALQIVAEKAPNAEVSNVQKLEIDLPSNMIKNSNND